MEATYLPSQGVVAQPRTTTAPPGPTTPPTSSSKATSTRSPICTPASSSNSSPSSTRPSAPRQHKRRPISSTGGPDASQSLPQPGYHLKISRASRMSDLVDRAITGLAAFGGSAAFLEILRRWLQRRQDKRQEQLQLDVRIVEEGQAPSRCLSFISLVPPVAQTFKLSYRGRSRRVFGSSRGRLHCGCT